MSNLIRYESIQEPLDEEERELVDPDAWDWENPIEVVVSAELISTLEIALTPEEHAVIAQAAAAGSMPTHRYIKGVALAAARAKLIETAFGRVTHLTRERRSG